MFEFTETVHIDAAADTVWTALQDIEQWWPPSNPEHHSIEQLDDNGITVGARLRIREKVAGIPGEAIGVITSVKPGTEVTWETDQARYRWAGATFTIGEGVTWRVDADGPNATRLSAHVWARFPNSLRGRLLGLIYARFLNGIERDRRHARAELEYLKKTIESAAPETSR